MHHRRGFRSGRCREFPLRDQFLEGLEVILLGMVGRGGDISKGTRYEINSMYNSIFRGNSWLGVVRVSEVNGIRVDGGFGRLID